MPSLSLGSVEQPSDYSKECAFPDAMCVAGIQKLREMWKQGELVDFTLITSDKTQFKVHRTHLACVSDYFYAMLSSEMTEKETDEVTLSVVTAAGLSQILDYIYGGKMTICQENLKNIVEAAGYLQVQSVLSECCLYVRQTLARDTCLQYAQLVDLYNLKLSDETLKQMETLISTHTGNFLRTGKHVLLPFRDLLAYLQETCISDQEYIQEIELFERVMEWLKAYPSRRERVYEVLSNIRFKLMTEDDLQSVQENLILTSDERVHDMIASAREYVCADVISKLAVMSEDTKLRGSPSVILFSGHTDDGHVSKSFYALREKDSNPSWIQFPDIPYEFIQASVASWNGYVFVCGGWTCWPSNGETTNACYVFDPRAWKWSAIAPMKRGRVDFPLVAHNDKLYALGGLFHVYQKGDVSLKEVNPRVDVFDPESNTWCVSGVMDTLTTGHNAISYKEHIYIYGGVDMEGSYGRVVKSYHISSGLWTEYRLKTFNNLKASWLILSGEQLKLHIYGNQIDEIIFEATQGITPSGSGNFGINAKTEIIKLKLTKSCHPRILIHIGNRLYFSSENPEKQGICFELNSMTLNERQPNAITLPDTFIKHPCVQNPLCCAVTLPA